MSMTSDLTAIKNVAEDVKDNKVTNLAYDSTAYSENTVASPESYDWAQHNNIPQQTASAMKMTETQIDKGWRLRYPILNKYFFNAFFGRVSYNLNKLSDFFHSAVSALINALGAPYGVATLDASGRLPASQVTETLMTYKGAWSALTNTPALSDGMSGAVKGDMYLCDEAGTVTFGTGNTVSFKVNDRAVYNGAQWTKWLRGAVSSVSEIFPDGNGNVDLTEQPDISKVLGDRALNSLLYYGIGKLWAKSTDGATYAYRGATYGNGIWVAFSESQGLWWSTDGKSWTKSTTASIASYGFRCVRYLNNIWVAGSDSHGVWWSTDGKTWTQGTGLTDSLTVYHSDFNNGLFVSSSSSGIWWSTDGKAWTQGTGLTSTVTIIRHTSALWLACTPNGVYWSANGKAWTQGTGLTSTVNDIACGRNIFVATTEAEGVWYSSDGKAWTQTSTTTIQGYKFIPVQYMYGMFVAGSLSHGIWYSTNGSTWTQISKGTSLTFGAIGGANGLWLACTTDGNTYASSNGVDWYLISNTMGVGGNIPFVNINFANGMFVLGSTAGLYYSDWTLFV